MLSVFLPLLLCWLTIPSTADNLSCSGSGLDWYTNLAGETPCATYQKLRQVCNSSFEVGVMNVDAPPDTCNDQVSACCCNSVAFSLSMLCLNCQKGTGSSGNGYDAGAGAYQEYLGTCSPVTNQSLSSSIDTEVCNGGIKIIDDLYTLFWGTGAWYYAYSEDTISKDVAASNGNAFTHCASETSASSSAISTISTSYTSSFSVSSTSSPSTSTTYTSSSSSISTSTSTYASSSSSTFTSTSTYTSSSSSASTSSSSSASTSTSTPPSSSSSTSTSASISTSTSTSISASTTFPYSSYSFSLSSASTSAASAINIVNSSELVTEISSPSSASDFASSPISSSTASSNSTAPQGSGLVQNLAGGSSHLSNTQIVGTAVGASVGAIVALILLYFLCRLRRRSSRDSAMGEKRGILRSPPEFGKSSRSAHESLMFIQSPPPSERVTREYFRSESPYTESMKTNDAQVYGIALSGDGYTHSDSLSPSLVQMRRKSDDRLNSIYRYYAASEVFDSATQPTPSSVSIRRTAADPFAKHYSGHDVGRFTPAYGEQRLGYI